MIRRPFFIPYDYLLKKTCFFPRRKYVSNRSEVQFIYIVIHYATTCYSIRSTISLQNIVLLKNKNKKYRHEFFVFSFCNRFYVIRRVLYTGAKKKRRIRLWGFPIIQNSFLILHSIFMLKK